MKNIITQQAYFTWGLYSGIIIIIVIVVVVVVVVVENGEVKVNKAFWSGISLLMKEATIVSETLVRFNHLALPIVPNDVID